MSTREPAGPGDLNLDPDYIRLLVAKARAALFEMPDPEADEPDETAELDAATGFESERPAHLSDEEGPDGLRAEAEAMIDSLNVDEQAELIALTLIGRGDYEASELGVAMREAKEQATGPASTMLFEMELFPNHLESGLEAYEAWLDEEAG